MIQVEPQVDSIIAGIEAAKEIDFLEFQENLHFWLTLEETETNHLGPNVINRAIKMVYEQYDKFQKPG